MESLVSSMGAGTAMNAANLLDMDAAQFGNDASYEHMWAVKTFKYAETHFKLISTFDSSKLRLTKYDDQVYRMFKRYFKDFKVDVINTDALKTEESKARWRPFCEHFKGKVEDYNFGTLLRIDCSKGYTEDNTELVTRIQFIAIELARNRRGFNACLFQNKNEDDNKAVEQKTDEENCEQVNEHNEQVNESNGQETANQVNDELPEITENVGDLGDTPVENTGS